jgi:hypothetical protein
MLDREEYVEQAHFFKSLGERLLENVPLQETLAHVRHEILATTKLPMAIDYCLSELKHSGTFAPAMKRLSHYFSPFQAYLIEEAEDERGRFDMRIAFSILQVEAQYRAGGSTQQGLFLYQFEAVSRNRLRYDPALSAIAADPSYDDDWRQWILTVRRQVGIIDFADLLYVRSRFYLFKQYGDLHAQPEAPVLFGEREGKIAWANRKKDPIYLFAALQRQLDYPRVPKPKPVDENVNLIPQLLRKLDRLEMRIKLLEEEQRGGIDITKFYGGAPGPGINE